MRSSFPLLLATVIVGVAGCSSSSGDSVAVQACKVDADCSGGAPICDGAIGGCVAEPRGKEVGYRDGTAASVTFTEIGSLGANVSPSDLGFNPAKNDELWVISYATDAVHIGSGVGTGAVTWQRLLDPAARHFMHKPPALAMGAGGTWGVCGDNDNGQNAKETDGSANLFMGPALMSLDLAIFAKRTPNGLGSHLDMLHESPNCKGIAHVEANVYWVFNGYDGALDLYDFRADHGPGNDDHSDGTVYRYASGQVKGVDGVASHIFYDASDKFLYVADTGNQRVVRLDTQSGTRGGAIPRVLEKLQDQAIFEGAKLEEVVPAGTLTSPSGLEVKGDLVYVTDSATSTFHVFDKKGKAVRKLATDLPGGSLAGFTFGPDGKIWFVDRVSGRVLRIDPK
jgi:DNA-binding beta-propeller fold protein YncE